MNKRTIITTSWDDGSPLDLKLAKLLKKHEIPATFYVPIKNAERESMDPKQIMKIAQDFDIGGHTVNHCDLTQIPLEMAWREISECKKELERIIGRNVVSFCYPRGAYNCKIVDLVKKADFKGARTLYLFQTRIKQPYQIGTTVYAHDYPKRIYTIELIRSRNIKLFSFLTKNLHDKLFFSWDEVARVTLDYTVRFGGIWHLWGHSWEIDERDDWKKLIKLFERIREVAENRNVSLMNNSELMLEFWKHNC